MIKLTGNSYVTSLSDDDSSYSNIDFMGISYMLMGKLLISLSLFGLFFFCKYIFLFQIHLKC